MSSVIPPVKDADSKKGKAFSHKTLVKERPVTTDESVVDATAGVEVETEAAHAGSLVDFVAPISESGQHEHIFDDENSLGKRLVILGTVLLPLAGLAGAIYMAFQYGMVSWLDVFMLIGGWYLTGMGTVSYTHLTLPTILLV